MAKHFKLVSCDSNGNMKFIFTVNISNLFQEYVITSNIKRITKWKCDKLDRSSSHAEYIKNQLINYNKIITRGSSRG